MSRKGALAMIAVVVLWAAMPAFACFMPAAQHACCRGMMQDCGSPAMNSRNCCTVQPNPGAVLPGNAATADSTPALAEVPAVPHAIAAPDAATPVSPAAQDSPPRSLPADSSILRI